VPEPEKRKPEPKAIARAPAHATRVRFTGEKRITEVECLISKVALFQTFSNDIWPPRSVLEPPEFVTFAVQFESISLNLSLDLSSLLATVDLSYYRATPELLSPRATIDLSFPRAIVDLSSSRATVVLLSPRAIADLSSLNKELDNAHRGQPLSALGGPPTVSESNPESESDRVSVPRATRSAFSHDDASLGFGEDGLEETGRAGVSKATRSTRLTNPEGPNCDASSCDQVPDSSSVTTSACKPVLDVHRRNATRELVYTADFHGDNDDDDGDSDRTEGDLRVTATEAAVCACGDSTPAHSVNLSHDSSGKSVDCVLTEFAIGGTTKLQPRLGDPRLRDGSAGGDAGGVQKGTTPDSSLVDSHPSVMALAVGTVSFGSNVGAPDQGSIPVTKPLFPKSDATLGNGVPLLGESADKARRKPSHLCIGMQLREAPSSDPPRGTGPLRMLLTGSLLSSEPDIWQKSCERAGIPQGEDVGDLSREKSGEFETSGRTSVTGETLLSAGQSRIWCGTTVGETTGISICPQNGPRPSESQGAPRTNVTR
jgi:hypothetical protein